MQQGEVIDLDPSLALLAAKLPAEHSLPLADSIIYATAQSMGATVWTQDADFEGLPGVTFSAKKFLRSSEPCTNAVVSCRARMRSPL